MPRSLDGAMKCLNCMTRRFDASTVEAAHLALRVAVTGDRLSWHRHFQSGHVSLAQLNVVSRDVLAQPLASLGPGNRHDVVPSRQHPGEGQLGDCYSFFGGDGFEVLDEGQIFLTGFPGESRVVSAKVRLILPHTV